MFLKKYMVYIVDSVVGETNSRMDAITESDFEWSDLPSARRSISGARCEIWFPQQPHLYIYI